ncbi:hypothetical protein PsorP6_012501 [Peronosclerospora sorghi]|uniref:Uncharacterized protein n=1 Tax=Peronosclerospora sorghi TaxID=230839 RepID=A0ACC0WGX7_9STRA|nr:hypothetical protein PsorP6_012501 [Peronosclerospora sorghi]
MDDLSVTVSYASGAYVAGFALLLVGVILPMVYMILQNKKAFHSINKTLRVSTQAPSTLIVDQHSAEKSLEEVGFHCSPPVGCWNSSSSDMSISPQFDGAINDFLVVTSFLVFIAASQSPLSLHHSALCFLGAHGLSIRRLSTCISSSFKRFVSTFSFT